MNSEIFTNINRIIERDSKSTTYKFALLRGTIDIIQDNSPDIQFYGNTVTFPTGLLIEKWMMYYYPILESQVPIPQSNGERNLSFNKQFLKIIDKYRERNGFIGFYEDLKRNGFPKDIHEDFRELSDQIYKALTQMPMKHIGFSVNHRHYSIFKYTPHVKRTRPYILDIDYLISNFGFFTIPIEYYHSFRMLGNFITGQDSLLFRWAEFSVKASKNRLSTEEVVNHVLRTPLSEREIQHSKQLFKAELANNGKLFCVWTGDTITHYEIDHIIPFSVWRNNDLWNLLPTKKTINNKKRDKIPTPETIDKHRKEILFYWEMLNKAEPHKFQKEIRVSLVGSKSTSGWQESCINQLQNSCEYLISERGFEPWII